MLLKLKDKLLLRKIEKNFKKVLKKKYSRLITKHNIRIVKLIYKNLANRYNLRLTEIYNCLPLTLNIDKDLEGAYGVCSSGPVIEKKRFSKKQIRRRKAQISLNKDDITTTTFIHEFGHYLRFLIQQIAFHNNKKAIEDFKKLVDILRSRADVAKNKYDNFWTRGGQFTEDEEENFAKSWEQYLKDGVSPDKKHKKLFNDFRKNIFKDMNQRSERLKYENYEDLQVRITPERKAFFDELFIGKKFKSKKKFNLTNFLLNMFEVYLYIAIILIIFNLINKHFMKIYYLIFK